MGTYAALVFFTACDSARRPATPSARPAATSRASSDPVPAPTDPSHPSADPDLAPADTSRRSAEASGKPARAQVLIRLRNLSDTLEMRAAYGIFPGDTVLFGDIPARGYSGYHPVKRAYRYAYLRVQAGGREWVLQPVDYVGEKPLEPGRYTWEIKPHAGPYPGFLDFEARQDQNPP